MRHLLAILLAVGLAGCNSWPDPVGGGMAEITRPEILTGATDTERGQHLACTLQNLAILAEAAQRSGHGTGQVALLETDAARAQREQAGHLTDAAGHTLDALDQAILRLQPELAAAGASPGHCTA